MKQAGSSFKTDISENYCHKMFWKQHQEIQKGIRKTGRQEDFE